VYNLLRHRLEIALYRVYLALCDKLQILYATRHHRHLHIQDLVLWLRFYLICKIAVNLGVNPGLTFLSGLYKEQSSSATNVSLGWLLEPMLLVAAATVCLPALALLYAYARLVRQRNK